MQPLARAYLHAAPSIASNITATLRQNDLVRLISERADLDWIKVATRSGEQGWLERNLVDFSRAVKSSSPDFELADAVTQTPDIQPDRTFFAQLHRAPERPRSKPSGTQGQPCGDAIQNGDFEAGGVSWVEETSGAIVRDDYPDPYQGDWVAWMGGVDDTERLTQVFYVPDKALDNQKLEFYLRVTSEEVAAERFDTLILRFLDASGTAISDDIFVADNTDKMGWTYHWVDLSGMAEYAGQNIQIQFEAVLNPTNSTSFVIDSVSLEVSCQTFYVYLPVIFRAPPPTPTNTPTSTPSPSPTACPNHDSCPSHCGSDCGSDCGYDCGSDCAYHCSSICTLDCVYDCGFDCVYDCGADWCYYN
jgi:hypothetical protein